MRNENLRPGQRGALNVILDRVAAREQRTAIVLPTRYGKSDIIRLVSILAQQEGLIASSLALSPGVYLREQLVRPDKLREMIVRYDLTPKSCAMREVKSASEYQPFANRGCLLSATMELATRNPDAFADLVKDAVQQTNLPLLVHVDECHQTSEKKKRGELVELLIASGALIVLYTATAVRADGELIPGFEVRVIDSTDARRYVVTDFGDGIHNRIDVYQYERCLVELVAHHTTSFREAWNEKPSPLCNLSREVIEVNLNDLSSEESPILLSACTESKAREYLWKAVRHPIVMEIGVRLFLRELELRQRINPEAAGIVFTGSDYDQESNKHAKEVERLIAEMNPE